MNVQRFFHYGHTIDVVMTPFGMFAYMDNGEPTEITENEYKQIKNGGC